MPLSDTAIKNAKPNTNKPYKLPDEKGMYLFVHSNGGKYFRLDYRFDGKRKTLALGVYPDTSLKQARDKRDTAKRQIADGIDPAENKKAIKQSRTEASANSFEVIAREWYERKMTDKSESHQERVTRLLNKDIFPYIGKKPIGDIKPTDLLSALRRIETRGALETAGRALQYPVRFFAMRLPPAEQIATSPPICAAPYRHPQLDIFQP